LQSASLLQPLTQRAADPVACISGGQVPGRMEFTWRRKWQLSTQPVVSATLKIDKSVHEKENTTMPQPVSKTPMM